MALTPSKMVPLGTPAPSFELPDVKSGRMINYHSVEDMSGLLVMFICNHCPFVKHIQEQLVALSNDYLSRGIGFVAISSNDVESHPEDSPEKMKAVADQFGYPFPYLYDESQEVAKAFGAECTPDFFLYDAQRNLYYRGQLDDSRPGNGKPVTGSDLRQALDALTEGKSAPEEQQPSVGCNIKWRSGD